MSADRAYGGVPATERRALRRARLVDAALDLLAVEGASAITVNRLCRQAGLNERYFYESFSGCAEVLVAAVDDLAEVLVTRALTGISAASDDPRSRARAAIAAAVDVVSEDRRRAVLVVEATSNPALVERRVALTQVFVELLVSQALAALHLRRTPDIESWALFASTSLFGGLLETITSWARGSLDVTRDELVERNTEMFMAAANHLPVVFLAAEERPDPA